MIDSQRQLYAVGVEALAAVLRDVARAVGGDVDPRAVIGWVGRALGAPIVVGKPMLHEALRFGKDHQWVEWSGGLIRPGHRANQTRLMPEAGGAATRTAVADPSVVRSPAATGVAATRTAAAASAGPPPSRSIHAAPVVAGSAPEHLSAGTVVRGERAWRLLGLAAEGGMGRVWRAEAEDSAATVVAIKTIAAPTAANRAALERELQLLRTLRRADYFPTIHDAFTVEGNLHVVMDWVPGRTLDQCVEQDGLIKVDRTLFLNWMAQIADRLAFLHAWPGRPILFRDLKPSNVIYDAESGRLRLVDFGIGHLAHPEAIDPIHAGTEGFMAPEVLEGKADLRSDIYAFGRLGLYLLFKTYQFGPLHAGSRPPLEVQRDLPAGLVRACLRVCASDPHQRPATILGALDLLHRQQSGGTDGEAPPVPRELCRTCLRGLLPGKVFCPICGTMRPGTAVSADAHATVAFDDPPVRAQSPLAARAARAYEDLLGIRASADLTTLRCLPLVQVEPYDYQREAAIAVVSRMGGRAMIADDVGLGKTIEAGLIMKEYIVRGLARRTLVIAPPGLLLRQLCDEFAEKFDIHFREFRSNGDILDQGQFVGPSGIAEADHVAVSLNTLRMAENVKRFLQSQWDFVLVDECHHIKARRSKGYQAVRQIVAQYTVFMSATPFSGNPEELWTVYSALRPGSLGDLQGFPRRFAESRSTVRDEVRAMTIRRRRTEVMVRFPAREARTLSVEMSDVEARRYKAVVTAARERTDSALAWIQPLLQVSASYEAVCASSTFRAFPLELQRELSSLRDDAHPKVRAFLEKFVDHLPRGEKALVFTHFRASQQAVVRLLRERKRGASALIEARNADDRRGIVERFRNDPTSEFLVCGVGAGEGLNLQFCGLLVNLDLPWNPMQLEQRIGRVQRLGQKRRAVSIVNAVLRDTIEERVLEILETKLGIFSGLLGDTEQILGAMFEGDDDSFERWVALAILPDGGIDRRRLHDFEAKLARTATDVRRDNRTGAGFVDDLLRGAQVGHGAPAGAPTQAPVDLSFLDAP